MSREALLAALRRTEVEVQEGGAEAVTLPRSADELTLVVRLANEHGAPLAVPGGEPRDGAVRVELRKMAEVLAFDDTSQLAHVQAGMPVGALEAELRRRELTLGLDGPVPEQPVGAWLAQGAPGARDHDNDPVDQLVAGVEAILPEGHTLTIRPAPRRAVGPDLVSAMIGARGRLGIVTAAHVVARRRAPSTELAYLFPSREAAERAVAWIRGRGVRPAAAHVVDAPEGAAIAVAIEGHDDVARAATEVTRRTAREHGGVAIAREEVARRPRSEPPPAPDAVHDLAAALDPNGVLG